MIEPLILSALWIFLFVSVVFIIALLKKDNSVIDIFYGLIATDVAVTSYLVLSEKHLVATLTTLLAVLWGVRLSVRIFLKNKGKGEDARYARWRTEWMQKGRWYFYVRSYLQVFLLQGVVLFVVSLPLVLINTTPAMVWTPFVSVGLFVWCVGFLFEVIADFQLDRFLRNPKNRGRVMKTGLFRFSRRPNYFGESLMWWGLATIAFSVPINWIAYASPALITYVVTAVTGPITESLWDGNSEYALYKKTTSYFIPWFPKRLSNPV